MSFKRLDPEDFLLSAQPVSQTVWSGYKPSLNTFQTSSNQVQSPTGGFYLSVYSKLNVNPDNGIKGEEVQFDIAYANKDGGGSTYYNASYPNITRSQTIYGQYRTLLLEDENSKFFFGGVKSDHFYALSISRSRYKEKMLPGSFNITLGVPGGSGTQILQLTDNSGMISVPEYYGTQRVYQIVSGSNGVATGYDPSQPNSSIGYSNSGSYGWFLPDTGTVLLNANALDLPFGPKGGIDLKTNTGSFALPSNMEKLYNCLYTGSTSPEVKGFTLNSEETISSDYIFIRARNSEFNYSENPSFIKGADGEVIFNTFINNPQVYPTTVGLYNDSNDLLAVAKLSRPLLKDFTKEILLRVKIDF